MTFNENVGIIACVLCRHYKMASTMQAPSTWNDVFIDVDLHVAASVYLDKLDSWDELAKSAASGGRLTRLVYRYEQLWLPLVAVWNQVEDAQPPTDVHWMWHLHQLRTVHYTSYCMRRFGRLLPHRLCTTRQPAAGAVRQTAVTWAQRYPDEPFDLPPDAGEVSK